MHLIQGFIGSSKKPKDCLFVCYRGNPLGNAFLSLSRPSTVEEGNQYYLANVSEYLKTAASQYLQRNMSEECQRTSDTSGKRVAELTFPGATFQ
jgi:hypothetical protein